MKANLQTALNLILKTEGAFPNINKSEPGGISKYGVSLQTYTDYCREKGLSKPNFVTILTLSASAAKVFYADAFAAAIRFGELPIGVDYRLLDVTVNLGVSGGIALLHRVLGRYEPSTHITDEDIAAIKAMDRKTLIEDIGNAWLSQKKASHAWAKDGKGWAQRAVTAQEHALAMIL